MLSNIISRIFGFFTMLFGVFQAFIAWGANHIWALVLAICSPLMAIFWSIWDWFQSAILDWVVDVSGANDSLDTFGDCVNQILTIGIYGVSNGGTVAEMVADIVTVLNFGAFVPYFMVIVVPTALVVFTYRFVKSWVPTVAGG